MTWLLQCQQRGIIAVNKTDHVVLWPLELVCRMYVQEFEFGVYKIPGTLWEDLNGTLWWEFRRQCWEKNGLVLRIIEGVMLYLELGSVLWKSRFIWKEVAWTGNSEGLLAWKQWPGEVFFQAQPQRNTGVEEAAVGQVGGDLFQAGSGA